MNKDPESWACVSPDAVLGGSPAQVRNVLEMALADIAEMAATIERQRNTIGGCGSALSYRAQRIDELRGERPRTRDEVWRHKKRGTTYRIVGEGELQSTDAIAEGCDLVVYQSTHDGRIWIRPSHEFHDGRFEAVEPPVDPENPPPGAGAPPAADPDRDRRLSLISRLRHPPTSTLQLEAAKEIEATLNVREVGLGYGFRRSAGHASEGLTGVLDDVDEKQRYVSTVSGWSPDGGDPAPMHDDLRAAIAALPAGTLRVESTIYKHMIAEIVSDSGGIAQFCDKNHGFAYARVLCALFNAAPDLLDHLAGVERERDEAKRYARDMDQAASAMSADVTEFGEKLEVANAKIATKDEALKPFAALKFEFDGFSCEPAALVFRGREYGRFIPDDHAAFQRMIDAACDALEGSAAGDRARGERAADQSSG